MRITLSTKPLYTREDVNNALRLYDGVKEAYKQALYTRSEHDISQLVTQLDLSIKAESIGFMNTSLCDFDYGRKLCDKVYAFLNEESGNRSLRGK